MDEEEFLEIELEDMGLYLGRKIRLSFKDEKVETYLIQSLEWVGGNELRLIMTDPETGNPIQLQEKRDAVLGVLAAPDEEEVYGRDLSRFFGKDIEFREDDDSKVYRGRLRELILERQSDGDYVEVRLGTGEHEKLVVGLDHRVKVGVYE